jgi:tartrate-resistant acid phosphatase type 5
MSRVEIHREPFIHLADLAHDRALIAWGAFYFERT